PRDVDDVRREPLAGDLEGGAGPGGRLQEEVDHRLAAQGRDLLDLPARDLLHGGGGVQDGDDLAGLEPADLQEVLALESHPPPLQPSGSWITTRSRPSCSRSSTRTISRRAVGRFFPT